MRFYRPLGHVLARIPVRSDGSIRLTALLASAGVFARKQLRRAKPVVDGVQMSAREAIDFTAGQVRHISLQDYQFTVREDAALTLAMHKPLDVVSTHDEGEGLRIFDLLPDWLFAEDLAPVGRLDKETTGLIVLTEDGQLNQRMRHPARGLLRRYEATLARPITDEQVARALSDGITLRDGYIVQPAELARIDGDPLRWSVAVGEGKYHEIRRLFAAMDSHVEQLHRVGYGPFVLQSVPIDPHDFWDDGIPVGSTLSKTSHGGASIVLRDALMRIEGDAQRALYETLQLENTVRMLEICVDEHA